MVEEKPQQLQIISTHLTSEEKVVAQSRVQVLHQRTRPRRVVQCGRDRFCNLVKLVPQQLMQLHFMEPEVVFRRGPVNRSHDWRLLAKLGNRSQSQPGPTNELLMGSDGIKS